MVITSQKNNKKYFWIKIPRTATVAYSRLFFGNLEEDKYVHSHVPYVRELICNCNDTLTRYINLSGISVVRNPMSRFISSLKFIKKIAELPIHTSPWQTLQNKCQVCGAITLDIPTDFSENSNFFEFYQNEKVFYEFMYDNFNKNCQIIDGESFDNIFTTRRSSFIRSFFHTQVFWVYHPNVKIFKYEKLSEFNHWIEEELGYDTSKLQKVNSSQATPFPIDFTTDKFKKLTKHLFYDDFRYFDYEFPI
jgi:hypothetical protein